MLLTVKEAGQTMASERGAAPELFVNQTLFACLHVPEAGRPVEGTPAPPPELSVLESRRKAIGAEPLPGYRLLEPLGQGAFGEVWKCAAPGGRLKAIKFVPATPGPDGPGDTPADAEVEALACLRGLRHPFLLSFERVERRGGELVLVMELAEGSLGQRLRECQRTGQPGIPRGELLGYLREAAEALDLLNLTHGLQHLDVKPQNLLLVAGHVKVGDFGQLRRLPHPDEAASGEESLAGFTPSYAAPELSRGVVSPHCDQYSLAVVYHELLTGRRPFGGANALELLLQHALEEPDLAELPPADRPVLARALAKDPEQRFATCTAFVRGLLAAAGEDGSVPWPGPDGKYWFPRSPDDGDGERWGLLVASERIAAGAVLDPQAHRAALAALFAERP